MPATLTLAGRFGPETLETLDRLTAAFEADNPDLQVEVVDVPGTATERRQWFADSLAKRDTSLDILFVNSSWLAGLANDGALRPLEAYVESSAVDVGSFLPATGQANSPGGQLLALPWSADVGLLYYREDLLDRHGCGPPTTWAELQRCALDIRAAEDLPYGYVWQAAAYESLTCNTLEFLWSSGADLLDDRGRAIIDIPQMQVALQQMSSLIASGASPPEVTTLTEGRALAAFQDGKAVFMRNGSYAWSRLEGQDTPVRGLVGVAPLPASCLGGQGMALSAYSLHPEGAFRLMAFLTSLESQVRLALDAGQVPALEIAYQDARLLAAEPFFGDVYTALSTARHRPHSPAYPTLSETIYSEVHRMLVGDQDEAATASAIQRRLETALGQP
jgi:multiple sugar transport system substrate-binding protein